MAKIFIINDTSVTAGADTTSDLGSSSIKWKDGYFGGTITVGSSSISGLLTVGTLSASGAVIGASGSLTGLLTVGSVTASGLITCGTLSASGALIGNSGSVATLFTFGTASGTGAVIANSGSISTLLTVGSITASGLVTCGTLSASGAVIGGSGTFTNTVTCGTLSASGAAIAASGSISGLLTVGTLSAAIGQIGDGTNYTSFATDGEITLAGTAKVKREFFILPSDFNPGASGPLAALHGIFPSYDFTIDDDMHAIFEVPHDWDGTADFSVEVYWAINEDYATNSGEVQWKADWRAVAVGEELTAGGSSGTIDYGDVNIPANANTIAKTTGTISGGSLTAGDLVAINIARIDVDDGADPTAEPYLIHIAIEYTVNKLGEAT